ncbi:MAG: prolyl oligopeptidase family serine peptidase [Actinomycetota bacterium]
MATELPHGSWPSPISAELVAAGGIGVSGPAAVGDTIWWSELRPTEGGRSVPVSGRPGESPVDRLPAPWSARTRVHEYGGGAWWLGRQHLYVAEWSDQRLYRLPLDGETGGDGDPEPEAVTPEPAIQHGWRWADGREHPGGAWLAVVREDHHGIGEGDRTEAANEIVAVPTDGGEPVVLVSGPDFVAAPRFSPDGRWLSWIEWNHPSMPWDATLLKAAPVFANHRLGNPVVVAGSADLGPGATSVVGADWTAAGRLVFSTDANGWWNLHAWHPEAAQSQALTALDGAEIGGPAWVFGLKRWVELPDGRLVVAVTTAAVDSLAVLTPPSPGAEPATPAPLLTEDLAEIAGLAATADGRVAIVGAGPRSLSSVRLIDPDGGDATVVRPPDDTGVDPAWFSVGEAISYPSGPDGAGPRTANAFHYPPTAPEIEGPAGQAPPLIVMGHGGPTAHADPALSLKVQYWTSRGFAVVDVNYGGSSGFGRAYRDLLQGTWGIVDVEDCINAAVGLADEGRVDGDRLAIRGGSAGGFTVLAALEQSDRFGAGTNLFGVADLSALAADTHKFESRYLDGLIGPYPEREDLYTERSPINHTDRLSSPLLVLQGLEDEIVPPNQSEAIVAAVATKGLPHAYVTFEGEQHGFRKAENLIRSFEVELWFYGQVFGFEPSDEIAPPDGAVGFDS